MNTHFSFHYHSNLQPGVFDQTLDCVLSQTYANWKCIVVDDDNTAIEDKGNMLYKIKL